MAHWRLQFTTASERQLAKLPLADQERITRYFRERVLTAADPRQYAKALAGENNLWRFRVGDYRIVSQLRDDVFTILVVKVAHRREVYR